MVAVGTLVQKVISFCFNKLPLIFCRLRIMLQGRTCLWPRLRNGLDPLWDMIQTNFFFFLTCLYLVILRETVQRALIITALWPGAHLHLVALCTTPGCRRLGDLIEDQGLPAVLLKQAAVFQGTLNKEQRVRLQGCPWSLGG